MTARLDAALAELAAALRAELREELATAAGGPPELLDIRTAAQRLGVGRTATYHAIGRGELRSVKVGRRRLVPADAISDLAQRGSATPVNAADPEVRRDATATPRRTPAAGSSRRPLR